MEDSKKYLRAGQIVGTRGISGEVKVKHFCDTAKAFCSIKKFYFSSDGHDILKINNQTIFKNLILMRLDGINTLDRAKELVGKYIYSCKCDILIPEGRYFIEDILGMDVIDIDSNINYGKIFNVIQNGAHDVYCIRNTEHKEHFLPAVDEMVNKIDINKGVVFVKPIKGIFND